MLILQQQVVDQVRVLKYVLEVRSLSASNDPLYVVDGIPVTSSVDGGAIFDILPQDIESMEILKDAAATAIYGQEEQTVLYLLLQKEVNKVRELQ